jgi:2-amino-4-hydroxy-6-hydroxymethyldihydropteridine diphosphokinase
VTGERVYLSLGSNVGDREKNLRRGIKLLSRFHYDFRVSRIYQSEPMYVKEQPLFLNAAAEGCTLLQPIELLQHIHGIEASLGRDRDSEERMGPRVLDIDILLFGDLVLQTRELSIPHPRMSERAFVLVPLLELSPGLEDPRNGRPYRELLNGLRGQGVYSWRTG